MCLPAIGLDDHPLGAPDEIGADHRIAVAEVEPLLNLRIGQLRGTRHRQKPLLELVPGRGSAGKVLLECSSELRSLSALEIVVKLIVARSGVEHLEDRRLVERTLKSASADHAGEIEHRARHVGTGDPTDPHHVGRPQGHRSVDLDCLNACSP
jgi:hypothetical protein